MVLNASLCHLLLVYSHLLEAFEKAGDVHWALVVKVSVDRQHGFWDLGDDFRCNERSEVWTKC